MADINAIFNYAIRAKKYQRGVCIVTKMDVLLNCLEQRDNYKKDHQAIQDAFNAQNTCGEYLGVEFPEYQEDANIIINNSAPQQQRQGWNQQQWSTYQGKYLGNYYNTPNQPSLRDLILEQARINENISKKLALNDKVIENINTKMDRFSSAMKDQLSYNKKDRISISSVGRCSACCH